VFLPGFFSTTVINKVFSSEERIKEPRTLLSEHEENEQE
jgi:hypothetical protein